MILAYYRDKKTGKIVNHHRLADDYYDTIADAEAAAEKYNLDPDCDRTAHVVEIKEDTLEEYLLSYADTQRRNIRETVQEALESIREAESLVQCLEV